MGEMIRATYIGPTGHGVDVPIISQTPEGLQRAKQLALMEIRKLALTHGIDLINMEEDDSGDTSDTGTGAPPF